MKTAFAFLALGLALLVACGLSLWSGKTPGLYGAIETRASVFYWLIVATYGVLGALGVAFAMRCLLWR